MKWYDIRFWEWACIGLVIGVILLTFTGCKTKEYIKVPSVRTEYVCRTDTFAKLDSIYMKDSVYVFRKVIRFSITRWFIGTGIIIYIR